VPILDATCRIVSLGLGVELWQSRGEGDAPLTREEIEKVKAECKTASFVSLHTSPEHWRWDPKGMADEIALGHALGAETLVLHRESLGLTDPSAHPDLPAIRRLAEVAREAGVMLALENGRDSMWALDLVLDEIGDDPRKTNLGICIDVGHAHISQDAGRQPIRNYLERYRGQLIHLHLHDNWGKADEHLPPGAGSIDWHAVLDAVSRVGYRGPGVLEIHSTGDLIGELAAARDYLLEIEGAGC